MNASNLNLARKWRSKNFDTIIGQDLSVRMLKNSLYLGHYFPVYLFSGQRGCGKTTTARVFAAAVNCEKLAEFQQVPKQFTIPCGECGSCTAMLTGKHPDFIEIDAASHTGVDNVRQIIDASSLLPLMGKKKIYLIDEAHMLSKAAFNAFLKILEEPPMSVLFILATTDPHKIIDTVKSRCFQLFFPPINHGDLKHHLRSICQVEEINFQDDGLSLIIKESEGSARDAINLLEQVRFSASVVDKKAVLQTLGYLGDDHLLHILEIIIQKDSQQLMSFLASISWDHYSPERTYQTFVELIRTAVWLKHGVVRESSFDSKQLQLLIAPVNVKQIVDMLELLCKQELAFARTTRKHLFLEMTLLTLCGHHQTVSTPTGMNNAEKKTSFLKVENLTQEIKTEPITQKSDTTTDSWKLFLNNVETLNDPLLNSIFCQGIFESFQDNKVTVSFSAQLAFFSDWLKDTQATWQPFLTQFFGASAQLDTQFKPEIPAQVTQIQKIDQTAVVQKAPEKIQKKETNFVPKKTEFVRKYAQPVQIKKEKVIPVDVSDKQQWPQANALLSYFPGIIVELNEVNNGKA